MTGSIFNSNFNTFASAITDQITTNTHTMNTNTHEDSAREFNDLSPDEQAEVARLLFEAASHRGRQWDAEAEIERILGREIDIDISEWAAALNDQDLITGGTFRIEDVAAELS